MYQWIVQMFDGKDWQTIKSRFGEYTPVFDKERDAREYGTHVVLRVSGIKELRTVEVQIVVKEAA